MMDDENFFGVKVGLDAQGFIHGADATQQKLDETVRKIVDGTKKADDALKGMADRLAITPRQLEDALKKLDDAQREQDRIVQDAEREADRKRIDHEREVERQTQANARRQAEQAREQVEAIRSRTEAFSRLRDVMLSVAAISVGGRGLAGINSLLQDTSQRGVSESTFAERTGTNVRRNVAEEEGAYLSGMSSRDEARQSIASYANAQAEYQRTGQSGLTTSLLQAGVQLSPAQLRMDHADFVSYVVGQLRHLGYNNQLSSSILEQSGLTSGGYTNLALHPDQMRRFNQMGDARAQGFASNQQRDLEFQQSWRHMVEDVSIMRDDIAHDLEPWVKELDHLAVAADKFAKDHPDAARSIVAATAVVVAMGGLVAAVLPMVGTLLALKALRGGSPVASALQSGFGSPNAPNAARAFAGEVEGVAGRAVVGTAARGLMTTVGLPALAAYIGLTIGKTGLSATDTIAPELRGRASATTSAHFADFAASVAGIEGARYDQLGGAGHKYAGRYQMGAGAIQDAARWLHEKAPTQAQFLADPDLQERYFKAYTASNEAILLSKSDQFRRMSADQRLAILGYAHNQGAGGALNWMRTGEVGRDAFGTAGTRYTGAFLTRISNPAQSSVTHNNSGTTLNVQHMTVKADNPHQIASAARQSAMLPNGHAMASNSGMH